MFTPSVAVLLFYDSVTQQVSICFFFFINVVHVQQKICAHGDVKVTVEAQL